MTRGNARADSRTAHSGDCTPWLRAAGSDVLILVHLQPGARRTALAGVHGNQLKISVQAPPIEGRANDALIAWLADRLGLARQRLRVVAGRCGRDKTILAAGIDLGAVRRQLKPQ